ncbi:hypothetical protein C8J57DRAFT_1238959 [Mycena rebaudengoi]|nr:hypothetical protein C8J57DRAFT_1238959 [Mycena rebaudengoi]
MGRELPVHPNPLASQRSIFYHDNQPNNYNHPKRKQDILIPEELADAQKGQNQKEKEKKMRVAGVELKSIAMGMYFAFCATTRGSFPEPSEFNHFGWSNSLGRMEITIEYDVKHTQKDYTSVRGRIDSQEEKEHVWILVHHAIIASLPGHASIWHVKNPIIEQSLYVQNGGKEFNKNSTALPNVWIPELCQYMGLKLQNVT